MVSRINVINAQREIKIQSNNVSNYRFIDFTTKQFTANAVKDTSKLLFVTVLGSKVIVWIFSGFISQYCFLLDTW